MTKTPRDLDQQWSDPMNIKSDFAILDVKAGRGPLNKHFAKRPRFGECPPQMRIPVTITGYIDDVWGGDDGVSREFGVVVKSVKIKRPLLPNNGIEKC